MTMAVAFFCRDGVVIGADRQVTGANYTFPERKVTSMKWENGHGIFAYAGNRDTYLVLVREMALRFGLDEPLKSAEVKSRLKESLEASLQKRENFQTLLGFWCDEEGQALLMSNGTRIVDVPECDVIGYGDSPLARSLIGRFRAAPRAGTVQQARIYAVHFISQAKKYDGQYVGDGIDVYSVDHSGELGQRCTRVLDAGQTGKWEEQTNLMQYWMDVLFSKATDKDYPISLDQFMERLKQFRAWVAPDEDPSR